MARYPGLSRLTLMMALAATLPLSGCLFRTRRVEPTATTVVVQEASQADLIDKINRSADRIKTLNATVDIDTDVGGAKKGKVTEYQEIRGYVLMRKPAMLRMIGLFPVLRNRAFDMVSDGQNFRLSLPAKNKFYMGRNDVMRPSKQPLENLRPQHIMEALLVRAIDPGNEVAVLESTTKTVRDPKSRKLVEQPEYTLLVVARNGSGWFLSRKIVLSRVDLQPHRQIIYDKLGNVTTDARYEDYRDFDGSYFPAQIIIERPLEEYSITLSVVKLKLNDSLTDEQFDLPQPAGALVVRLDEASPEPASKEAPKKPPEQPAK